MQKAKNKAKHAKRLKGVVVSDKMTGTVVVEVSRLKEHRKYKKRFRKAKHYKADDPKNKYKAGDKVVIEECRPLSKDKHWKVVDKSK